MNKSYQVSLMRGALTDYQEGLMPLGTLVNKIESLLGVIEDEPLANSIFSSLSALDEIHAVTQIAAFEPEAGLGNFDFETQGRPVVDTAIQDIESKLSAWLSHNPSSGSEG